MESKSQSDYSAEPDRLRRDNERLLRCIAGIEDELIREPPRVGDALWICNAARANEHKERVAEVTVECRRL